LKARCSCPYQGGPLCKHEVAAFYAISESFFPKESQLEKVLQTLPKQLLVDELVKFASRDDQIYTELMIYENEVNSLRQFEQQLEGNVAMHTQFQDYLTGYAIEKLVCELQGLLNEIKNASSYRLMIEKVLLLREECEGMIGYIDDLEGVFSEFLGELHSNLQNLIFLTMDEMKEDDVIFSLLMQRLEAKETDIDFELLDLVSEYGVQPKKFEVIISHIKKNVNHMNPKTQETLYKKWYELLLTYQEDRVDAFLTEYQHVFILKGFQVKRLVEKQRYNEAIPLILELEKKDRDYWRRYRYQVYEQMGAEDKMLALAEELFLEGDFSYYLKLKNLAKEPFNKIYPILKEKISSRSLYLKMIEYEHDVKAMLAYVKEDLSYIERAASLLWDTHETEVITLYETLIKQELIKARDRVGYRRICLMLQKFRHFTTGEAYLNLINHLIKKYPRRRALIEELQRLTQEVKDEKRKPFIEQLSMKIV
ncbi:MAG: SWIM zinc finger family protein, partial [Turicibacter sp.]|nr:SWIM zinc finger family protein [Turicibacter sp.]